MPSLVRITAPAEVPLSLAEAKAIARLDGIDDDDDAVIAGYIRVATDWTEQHLGKALISQVWSYTVDGFPWGYHPQIRLPLGPVQTVDEVLYVDNDGVPTVLATSAYVLSADSLWPSYATTWPVPRMQRDAVSIRFTAGYGLDWNTIPEAIRHGIAMLVAGYYDGCQAEDAVIEMIRPYRGYFF
jgi:uncharacterized phiE125 gp8 family phage protein